MASKIKAVIREVEKISAAVGGRDTTPAKWMGKWEAEKSYGTLQKVEHLGNSYVCIKACAGVDPEADVALGDGVQGMCWLLIAKKGDDGEGIESIDEVGGGEEIDGGRVVGRWKDYRITYASGKSFDYRVFGGGDGKQGPAGAGITNIFFKEATEEGNVYYAQVGQNIYPFTAPKGDKGNPFTYEDFTQEQLDALEQGARAEAEKAAASATAAAKSASSAAAAQSNASNYASNAKTQADRAASAAQNAANQAADRTVAQLTNQVQNLTTSAQNAANTATQKAKAASTAATTATDAAESAGASATKAEAARMAIENMTVEAETLEPTEKPTVEKTADGDAVRLTFGLPKGDSGVYIGSEPPENANVWIDPSGNPNDLERWTFELSDGTLVEKDVFAR